MTKLAPELGRSWPKLEELGLASTELDPKVGQIWLGVGQRWTKLGEVGGQAGVEWAGKRAGDRQCGGRRGPRARDRGGLAADRRIGRAVERPSERSDGRAIERSVARSVGHNMHAHVRQLGRMRSGSMLDTLWFGRTMHRQRSPKASPPKLHADDVFVHDPESARDVVEPPELMLRGGDGKLEEQWQTTRCVLSPPASNRSGVSSECRRAFRSQSPCT